MTCIQIILLIIAVFLIFIIFESKRELGKVRLTEYVMRSKWVRGTLCQVQHRFSRSQGKQIEYLTPICPTLENLDKQIPALIYRVQVTMSPRFKRLLPLVCQVPGRAGIRIHRGTRPDLTFSITRERIFINFSRDFTNNCQFIVINIITISRFKTF